ncbi:hypothetical protein NHH03_26720 [Stieleria sp. TO1_6]|uniref:hypothetical protein n=1 Tax=Stieleria tagensis TaxID=2956795 RepID=UPI00209B69DD|nr:hypothetical protein [Stieleria tagensis]MCO8125361.1 hypothetical protein [Stieleria tagensis]
MKRLLVAICLLAIACSPSIAQQSAGEAENAFRGPTKDVSYHIVLLAESDDQNRRPYDGPARSGLETAGFQRLVIAGSATAMVSVGQRSTVTGVSRYGQLSVTTSMLNTTHENELQVKINLQAKNQSPVTIDTAARVPLGRWFVVGAAESRIGIPTHTDDGKRCVAIMKIDNGVILLD